VTYVCSDIGFDRDLISGCKCRIGTIKIHARSCDQLPREQVLNAKTDAAKHAEIETRLRLFRNGEQIYSGTPTVPMAEDPAQPGQLMCAGAVQLGDKMLPGDYVLQVAVTDKLAKAGHGMAAEAMDFEVRP
jgi:hypothetical protein